MKKAIAISGRLLFLVAMLAATWFLRSMDWTVLNVKLYPFTPNSMGACVLNCVLFLLCILGVAWLFRCQDPALSTWAFFGLLLKKCLWLLLLVRLATDAVIFVLSLRPTALMQAAVLVVEAVSLTVSFAVLRRHIVPRGAAVSSRARVISLVGLCLLAAAIAAYVWQFQAAVRMLDSGATVPDFSAWVNQTDLALQLTKLAFYGVTWITLFTGFGLWKPESPEVDAETGNVEPI